MKVTRAHPKRGPKKAGRPSGPRRNAVTTALNRGKKRAPAARRNAVTTALNKKRSPRKAARTARKPAARRSLGNSHVTTAFNAVTTALNTVTTALNRRRPAKRNTITTAFNRGKSRKRVSSGKTAGRRGSTARTKGANPMASSKQRDYRAFVKKHAKAGKNFKQIGALWRGASGGKKTARKNKSGRPLTGKAFRPSLPKGPAKAVRAAASRAFKRATSKRMSQVSKSRKPRKAKKNPIYTLFNQPLSSAKARSLAMQRWHGGGSSKKRKKARRNPGLSVGGLLAKFKEVASAKTAKEGLAVLGGAIVATGAPSLIPSWNVGWLGVGLSLVSAATAAALAATFAPALLIPVASGGVVVVGLRLVAQFMPRALRWQLPGGAGVSGFLLPFKGSGSSSGVGGGVAGFLAPPPGAKPAGGAVSGMGLMRSSAEGFRSAKP